MTDRIQYFGFDVNGRECEVFLGDSFETHLPSRDQIIFRDAGGEVVVNVGDWIDGKPGS